jgi:hypothetical protein
MAKRQTKKADTNRKGVVADDARDEANKRRFTSPYGVPAQDLPGGEHGQNVVDPPEEMQRNLPHQHGGEMPDANNYAEGGMRGAREMSDADRRGGRKHN